MQHETMVMFNMTEPPIKEEHVAWNVEKKGGGDQTCYVLSEIVKATYRHPDARDVAVVTNLEVRDRGKVMDHQLIASPYVIMYHAQQTVAMVAKT